MSAEQYGAYSVLMSVYNKENPTWLRLAIESMQTQTLPTSDFVLVCDGPLTPELDGVIAAALALRYAEGGVRAWS